MMASRRASLMSKMECGGDRIDHHAPEDWKASEIVERLWQRLCRSDLLIGDRHELQAETGKIRVRVVSTVRDDAHHAAGVPNVRERVA
jgi:hypothetical protein